MGITCFTDFIIRMHLNIYKAASFELIMMINAARLKTLNLVLVNLTLIQDYMSVEQNFWSNYLTKFSVDLDGSWYTFDT